MVSLVVLVVSFVVLVFGIGPVLMPVSLGRPLVRVTVGIAASVVAIYLAGLAIYATNLPRAAHLLVFLLPAAILGWRRVRLRELWADSEVRGAFVVWGALACWTLGLQFAVFSYSGATWEADWYEHYDRARFFLGHWSIYHKFLGWYSIAARPPLMNVVSAEFLGVATNKFFIYQATCTLMAGLVAWPACLLQRRLARPGSPVRLAWLLLFLLALPTLAQNAAFTWTKLPTAFFILVGVALLSERETHFASRLAGWLAFTAAMLSHYSAGPWLVAIAVALFARHPAGWRAVFTRQTIAIGGACALLFGTWLGWSLWNLGVGETFGSNSTVADGTGMDWQRRVGNVADNLYLTSVPVLLRTVDYGGYWPIDSLAHVRDEYFNSVQSSALMIAGSLGVVVAACLLWCERRNWSWCGARFWGALLLVGTVLGIAVHTEVVRFGVAHICLQAMALIVVAWLAARLPGNPRLQLVHGIGLALDLSLGVLGHFALQSLWLHRWHSPGVSDGEIVHTFGHAARMNFQNRIRIAEPYLYDLPGARVVTALLLIGALCLLVRAFREPGERRAEVR